MLSRATIYLDQGIDRGPDGHQKSAPSYGVPSLTLNLRHKSH